MSKKFGRPAPSFDTSNRSAVVRQINLPREGHALEGFYDAVAAQDAMRMEGYKTESRLAFSRGLAYWAGIIGIWCGGIYILAQLV